MSRKWYSTPQESIWSASELMRMGDRVLDEEAVEDEEAWWGFEIG